QLDELVRAVEPGGARVPGHASFEIVSPGLDNRIDDPAQGLPVLCLEAARFDLDLVEELARHAGSERAVDDVVGADASEARIGDVDAVDQVGILEACRAPDRVIPLAGPEAADHPGRYGVGIGDCAAAADGVGDLVVFEVRAARARADVAHS